MEYTTNKLSKMSGVSARTLRYYDEIDLLKPVKIAMSGYRIYGEEEVDRLQQILFYKELGFSLGNIKNLLSSENDKINIFNNHLLELQKKRERLDTLINNVSRSILAQKGEICMSSEEKFEGFKQKLVDENEALYGKEIREKYGDEAVNRSNEHIKGMSKEQLALSEKLCIEFEKTLKAAFLTKDPSNKLSQKACDLHRQWLSIFYPQYNKSYHKAMGEMYVNDHRFKKYYEKIAIGCTEFLKDAIDIYCK